MPIPRLVVPLLVAASVVTTAPVRAAGIGDASAERPAAPRARPDDALLAREWRFGDGLPTAEPANVAMSAARLGRIDRSVQRGIRAGGFPGAAVVVGRKGFAVWSRGFGRLTWATASPAVSADSTIYDLASLTKVVATTTALMILWDEGRLDLDAPVVRYLPEFTGGGRDAITVEQLLTHHSGLPAGLELWRRAASPLEARDLVLQAPVRRTPGSQFEYSDLGPILLGMLVERVSGETLDLFTTRRIFRPLGMTDTRFRPPQWERPRIAPTATNPPRGYPLRGEVHDENAWRLGGVAGHAGLFSTAADLSVFAQMLLDGGAYRDVRIVSDSAVRRFTARTAGRRALGWDTCEGEGGCGRYMGPTAFGHTGYTGTSMWIDPERALFVVLLTNRVHDPRARRPATVVMDVRHDLADAVELAVLDDPDGVKAMPAQFRADVQANWNPPARRRARR